MKRSASVALVLAISFGPGVCAGPKDAPAKKKDAVKVGQQAPAFTLKDQHAKRRSLDEFLGKGPVALVFFRSADW
jgi:cytochrome oxidase Cu insertion factor (SCO1/SenC/PrrC family)